MNLEETMTVLNGYTVVTLNTTSEVIANSASVSFNDHTPIEVLGVPMLCYAMEEVYDNTEGVNGRHYWRLKFRELMDIEKEMRR